LTKETFRAGGLSSLHGKPSSQAVSEGGLEPPRPCGHYPLKLLTPVRAARCVRLGRSRQGFPRLIVSPLNRRRGLGQSRYPRLAIGGGGRSRPRRSVVDCSAVAEQASTALSHRWPAVRRSSPQPRPARRTEADEVTSATANLVSAKLYHRSGLFRPIELLQFDLWRPGSGHGRGAKLSSKAIRSVQRELVRLSSG
jgi:hypothetical protein